MLNCGDSRTLVVEPAARARDGGARRWRAAWASRDHAPGDARERARLAAGSADGLAYAPAECGVGGVWRVRVNERYSYAVSRSLEGALLASRGITAEPDVTVVPLGESAAPGAEDEAIVVVASDGVWCAVENDAAAALVGALREEGASAEEAARQLCERAAADGSTDNLSCVVMYA